MCCMKRKKKHMDNDGEGSASQDPSDVVLSSITGDISTSEPAPIDLNIDWDSFYEEDATTDGSQESRPYVLSHFLGQIKIGMDLMEIALPSYMLERRSLLEMYSEFFAHPDLFVSIADAANAKDRLLAVVKWYLATFSSCRKSDVAKKPYNPLLGEVFSCWWTVGGQNQSQATVVTATTSGKVQDQGHSHSHAHKEKDKDPCGKFNSDSINTRNSPFFNEEGYFLPWCAGPDKLIFFAEQVSHHPPISAFYAEHAGKKICVNAHIWTKSTFLGLSVGVQSIGEAVISVSTAQGGKEEYVMTFPTGYVRSVLSVPWVELGGETKIGCEQSGFNAQFEFCTKSLFGKDKNRVIARLFAPSEKKPYMVLDGVWNDVLAVKVPEGSKDKFDIKGLKTWRKETRKIVEQESVESRRVWKDVTRALKINDVDAANAAKKYLEDRQRAEARARDEASLGWQQRMFQKSADKWLFIEPLEKRCKQ